jgi:radical SAM superfamily enzyme YgiQ (UPF0313 family)
MIINSEMKLALEAGNGLAICTLDDELIALMKHAGFIWLNLALEHANDYIRMKVMRKSVTIKKVKSVLSSAKANRLVNTVSFVFGMPEETIETVRDNIKFINEVDFDDFQLFSLMPFPGTDVYEQAKRDSLLAPGIDFENLWKGEWIGQNGTTISAEHLVKPYAMSWDETHEQWLGLQVALQQKCALWRKRVKK